MNIIVVDLDGTLYKGNTFHVFVIYIFKQAIYNFNLFWFVYLVFWTKLRFFKLISHKKWKYQLLKSCNNKEINTKYFVTCLDKNIEQYILNETNNYKISILATAAPSLYAIEIAKKYNFSYCVATEFTESYQNFKENIQEQKFINVQKLLQTLNNEGIDLMITDHLDDALLIKHAKKSWLINANEKLKKYINENNLTNYTTYINKYK
ncbi:hypothetical protein P3875_07610 [Myroides sp. JBRI-B21084]|uniref:hypothetical protein n=1 Tax=Myroides sp. JBRI-B21084 TaxID=3119977 RepID=UPI0026E495DA|nr:hypothetical protein [Paenimyroides cloacae]WKW45650.1 hypothetical protein P3875_07610 [Paenimyroides cloacae]